MKPGDPKFEREQLGKAIAVQELDQSHLTLGGKAGLARAAVAQGDLATALAHVSEILAYLAEGGGLQGTWEPLRIYLTCYQVLQLAGDQKADEILETAFNLLEELASRIPDQAYRSLFLEKVAWHREILSAWEARLT